MGYNTYHHTLFEMLGNWSFGDSFKKDAIAWAWELVMERWGLPANRLYATVYAPGKGDLSEFDREAWDLWAAHFENGRTRSPSPHRQRQREGQLLDDGRHRPLRSLLGASRRHDPERRHRRQARQHGLRLLIEIWNLVFIQYNAEADGIIPGNTGRNYVLRRILRRAVKYGRALGFTGDTPFLPELVDTLVAEFSHVFPEIKTRAEIVKETLATKEESFNKTLDRGMEKFEKAADGKVFPPEDAFQLYDTYGFPPDLTALLCRERGISLDEAAVKKLVEKARERSRGVQKKAIVRTTDLSTEPEPTPRPNKKITPGPDQPHGSNLLLAPSCCRGNSI